VIKKEEKKKMYICKGRKERNKGVERDRGEEGMGE
jgi:hypothetical protein